MVVVFFRGQPVQGLRSLVIGQLRTQCIPSRTILSQSPLVCYLFSRFNADRQRNILVKTMIKRVCAESGNRLQLCRQENWQCRPFMMPSTKRSPRYSLAKMEVDIKSADVIRWLIPMLKWQAGREVSRRRYHAFVWRGLFTILCICAMKIGETSIMLIIRIIDH